MESLVLLFFFEVQELSTRTCLRSRRRRRRRHRTPSTNVFGQDVLKFSRNKFGSARFDRQQLGLSLKIWHVSYRDMLTQISAVLLSWVMISHSRDCTPLFPGSWPSESLTLLYFMVLVSSTRSCCLVTYHASWVWLVSWTSWQTLAWHIDQWWSIQWLWKFGLRFLLHYQSLLPTNTLKNGFTWVFPPEIPWKEVPLRAQNNRPSNYSLKPHSNLSLG